jgi:hypothetical protein
MDAAKGGVVIDFVLVGLDQPSILSMPNRNNAVFLKLKSSQQGTLRWQMKIGGDGLFKLKLVITENTPTNLTL